MPKKTHFFVRQTKKNKETGKTESHKIGIIVLSYDDNLLDISGAFCSPLDNFSQHKAETIGYGRLHSKKEHIFTTNVEAVLDLNFSDLLIKLGFGSHLLPLTKKPRYYDDIVSKYIKTGGSIDIRNYTTIMKRAVHDLTNVSDTI